MSIAVHAITKNGVALARQLAKVMPEVDLFIGVQFSPEGNETGFCFPLSVHFDRQFHQFSHHICLFSVGIAARIIAPRLVDKRTDPAVVCVDEQGHHAVAFSGGHRGGANELCERVAFLLEGQAVVTTASDNAQTLSADMMGAHLGWTLDPSYEKSITSVSAAIVNAKPVVICQQSGERSWWKQAGPLPLHLELTEDPQRLQQEDVKAGILISDKTDLDPKLADSAELALVVWRPRSLFIGIGCDRNTPQSAIERGLAKFMADNFLAIDSIAELASIDLKADETGIVAAANRLDRPFNTFNPQTLEKVVGVENPSETVKRCIGVSSVAEAACLHASGRSELLIPKSKFKFDGFNMTLAACRRDFPLSQSHQADKLHSSHKPMKACPNRPIKHYLYHLIVCEGGRCDVPGQTGLAHHLRTLLKQFGFARGAKRIKVSRSHCLGCCRKLVPMVIYQGKSQTELSVNHALWLQKVDKLTDEQWKEVFQALVTNMPLKTLLPSQYLSEQEVAA
ncbi:cobalamin biosynthesis protein CbiG [Shewanella canadensis]|uniref:Cobalamin biosynthesis protein CbiG n=1 Tax=Shewanella canadensis TaxID=271096 RepID=A0A3S0IQF6_9GAMM|nr:cobalamin biosynthesis protein [Shewanella canadensis]RTR37593.1 cobalamin biosynthesis protein CbiG [Shewanella canadensis]